MLKHLLYELISNYYHCYLVMRILIKKNRINHFLKTSIILNNLAKKHYMIKIVKHYKSFDEARNKIKNLDFNFYVHIKLTRNTKLGLTATFDVDKKNVDNFLAILKELELDEI